MSLFKEFQYILGIKKRPVIKRVSPKVVTSKNDPSGLPATPKDKKRPKETTLTPITEPVYFNEMIVKHDSFESCDYYYSPLVTHQPDTTNRLEFYVKKKGKEVSIILYAQYDTSSVKEIHYRMRFINMCFLKVNENSSPILEFGPLEGQYDSGRTTTIGEYVLPSFFIDFLRKKSKAPALKFTITYRIAYREWNTLEEYSQLEHNALSRVWHFSKQEVESLSQVIEVYDYLSWKASQQADPVNVSPSVTDKVPNGEPAILKNMKIEHDPFELCDYYYSPVFNHTNDMVNRLSAYLKKERYEVNCFIKLTYGSDLLDDLFKLDYGRIDIAQDKSINIFPNKLVRLDADGDIVCRRPQMHYYVSDELACTSIMLTALEVDTIKSFDFSYPVKIRLSKEYKRIEWELSSDEKESIKQTLQVYDYLSQRCASSTDISETHEAKIIIPNPDCISHVIVKSQYYYYNSIFNHDRSQGNHLSLYLKKTSRELSCFMRVTFDTSQVDDYFNINYAELFLADQNNLLKFEVRCRIRNVPEDQSGICVADITLEPQDMETLECFSDRGPIRIRLSYELSIIQWELSSEEVEALFQILNCYLLFRQGKNR